MSGKSLKPGWKMVKFGDIAQNITVRANPADAQTDIYVGLEHLDPETIHLRKWGHPSDVTGQKLEFKKGDVIFGRRRAYQRKLAVAEFDGICSAHAMVVRAKPKVILPEFLPFFLQSDMFMERAIKISVGSLSPTINWKTLQIQEFPLPPLEEQKRIAEILWVADEAVERYTEAKVNNDLLYLREIDRLLFDVSNKAVKVENVSQINRETLSESKIDKDFQFDYIDIGSVVFPKTLGPLKSYKFSEAPSRARRCVKDGDILVSTVRPNLQSFVRLPSLDKSHIVSTGFAVITPCNEIIGNLLFHAFFSSRFSRYCDLRVAGTSYPAISAKDVARFKIHIPLEQHEQLVAQKILNILEQASMLMRQEIKYLTETKMLLIENLLMQKPEVTHV